VCSRQDDHRPHTGFKVIPPGSEGQLKERGGCENEESTECYRAKKTAGTVDQAGTSVGKEAIKQDWDHLPDREALSKDLEQASADECVLGTPSAVSSILQVKPAVPVAKLNQAGVRRIVQFLSIVRDGLRVKDRQHAG
jgi:hypothetical protein